MKYPLIASKVATEVWSLRPEVFNSICNAVFHDARLDVPVIAPATVADSPEDDAIDIAQIKIIPVHGVIGKHLSRFEMMCGGCSVDRIAAELKAAQDDSNVEKIVLHFHTPGGMVMGGRELWQTIVEVASVKPVIGYADGDCCSMGLYFATACNPFYVSPSSRIGSIGCYTLSIDETEALKNEGVKVNAMVSGKFKLAGAPFKELTDEERGMVQARVDKIGADFRGLVSERWPDVPKDNMQGQVFTGEEWTAMGGSDGLANDMEELVEIIGGNPGDYFRISPSRMEEEERRRERGFDFKRNEKGEITGMTEKED